LNNFQIDHPIGLAPDFISSQLVYLDMSMAFIAPEVLATILNSCTSLVKASFESVEISTKALIGLRRSSATLDTLNFALATIRDPDALADLIGSSSR